MSDVYSMRRGDIKSGIGVYLVDDVGDGSIDRVAKLLAGIPHGADKAIGSAIKRAATSGEAYAARAIRQEYFIGASDFKRYTKSKRNIVTEGGSTTVNIEFKGQHIPLLKFDTKVGGDGRVVTRVKRSSAKTVLDHVFSKTVGMHGHAGVFERVSGKRLPIEEKLGPSAPQMMSYNDDIAQEIGDKTREAFDQRIEHEMLAVMNGWRQK